MPAEIAPPELARLIDFAERSREHDWSLRSALTRYAQGQPQRASDVLALVRRIESVIPSHLASLRRDGPTLWDELQSSDAPPHTGDSVLPELLRGMIEFDRLGDILAEWAADPTGPTGERPDSAVDAVTLDVDQRLEQLGVPHEERQRPPRQRS
ncbi:MAG: hypothetical protein H0V96_12580 [Acidimicrobiia bacterium]|nr:hypothetical protein [Acidimicrobiia bacterium]